MSEMWSAEYWAKKGDVDLYMYRKRKGAPQEGEAPMPIFFLVHGSSFSAPTSFDLTVNGSNEYSTMDYFAELGFDVWTVDHEGYGRSSRTDGNSGIASGAEDLKAAMVVMERETGQKKAAFYGQSSGALRAAAFAEVRPENVERLILDAFVWTGEGSPTLAKRREGLDHFRTHNTRPVSAEFYRSIFTRDGPGMADASIGDAIAEIELKYGDSVPTGTYLDMCANLPVCDPEKIDCPVLLMRGENDGIATEEDCLKFFVKLPNKDKQFVILPGQAHVGVFGYNKDRFNHVLKSFVTMPARVDT
jgi:pimeloyl-ACP methyl ester carboxylesterase